jgi:hypothetical protein
MKLKDLKGDPPWPCRYCGTRIYSTGRYRRAVGGGVHEPGSPVCIDRLMFTARKLERKLQDHEKLLEVSGKVVNAAFGLREDYRCAVDSLPDLGLDEEEIEGSRNLYRDLEAALDAYTVATAVKGKSKKGNKHAER